MSYTRRNFLTTRADRIQRNNARTAVHGEGSLACSNTRRVEHDPRQQQLSAPEAPPCTVLPHSTLRTNIPSSGFSPNLSLLDISNDALETLITVDEDQCVNIRHNFANVSNPQVNLIDFEQEISDETEYRNIDPTSFRRQTNVFDSYVGPMPLNLTQHFNDNFPMRRPEQQLGTNVVRSRPDCEMSKTDRDVINKLIDTVIPITGSDERALIQFLKRLRPIFEISPENSKEIIKLLIPKVNGQMFQIWMQAVSSKVEWDVLHVTILNYFLSPQRIRELQLFEIERPQRPDEQFMDYVEDCISSAFALKTIMTEREVIESILNKCLPQTRLHFTFGAKPSTINELRCLAGSVTNAIKSDQRFFGHTNMVGPEAYVGPSIPDRSHEQAFQNVPNNRRYNSGTRGRGNNSRIVCHRCGNQGHIARSCRAPLN